MTFTNTQKTPSAELAGRCAEGLINPSSKEMNTMKSTVSTRLDLNGLTVDVDPFDADEARGVDITFFTRSAEPLGARTQQVVVLTHSEARKLAEALLDASAPTVGMTPMEEIEEHARIARKNTVAMTPAKAAALMKAGAR